jgi:DNA-binding NarL/FixJ family response regulator
MLEQLGYAVIIEASHGKEFIHQVNDKNQPDIIMLDTRLYVMDSHTFLQWIKINYPQIPVIAVHSKNDPTSLDRIMKGGAAGYIYKTSTPHEVNRVIKEVLGSSKYFIV